MDGVLDTLEKHFTIIDKQLVVDDELYPIFNESEVVSCQEEIIALASRPYRGQKDPMILDKKVE